MVVKATHVTATAWRPTIHGIKNRKVTARSPGGDRTATVGPPHGCCSYTILPHGRRKGAMRPPQGRHETAVRFSRQTRQGNRSAKGARSEALPSARVYAQVVIYELVNGIGTLI